MLKHLRGFSALTIYNQGSCGKLAGDGVVLSLSSPELKTFHFCFPLPLLFGNQQRELQALFLLRSYINYYFFEFLKQRTFRVITSWLKELSPPWNLCF